MAVFSYMSFSESTMRHPAQQAQDEHKAMTFLSFLLAEEKKRLLLFPPPSDTVDGFLSWADSRGARVWALSRDFCATSTFEEVSLTKIRSTLYFAQKV